MNDPDAAIAYLESDIRMAGVWRRSAPDPLISLRAHFELDIFTTFDEQHDLWCKDGDSLCTGDGFRWKPSMPALRF